MNRRRFTKDEVALIHTVYGSVPPATIAAQLGRSKRSIVQKAQYDGLGGKARRFCRPSTSIETPNPFQYTPKEVLAYTAGLLDGEGSIDIHHKGTINLAINNTNPKIMDFLCKHFGGQVYSRNRGHWKRSYVWMLTRTSKVKALLQLLSSYLIIKIVPQIEP